MIRHFLFIVAAAAVVAGVGAGCNGGSTSPPPFFTGTAAPTPTPTPTPLPQHLYVGNDLASGDIRQYNLPITSATQAANFTINAAGAVASVELDANGNLAAGLFLTGQIAFFNAPLSAASVPSATFANGTANIGQGVFTPAGDLWAITTGNRANLFTHPFSNASTPSAFVTNAVLGTWVGAGLDAAQNLYITHSANNNVYVFAPPYTGAPIVTPGLSGATTGYRKLTVSATLLFVCSDNGTGTGRVDVYTLPITAASAPAFAITTGVNAPEAVALDVAGNLYVGNSGNSTVAVYAPPFSTASAPTVTLTVSTGAFAIFGIAIGK
jgi:hypothetical protein